MPSAGALLVFLPKASGSLVLLMFSYTPIVAYLMYLWGWLIRSELWSSKDTIETLLWRNQAIPFRQTYLWLSGKLKRRGHMIRVVGSTLWSTLLTNLISCTT